MAQPPLVAAEAAVVAAVVAEVAAVAEVAVAAEVAVVAAVAAVAWAEGAAEAGWDATVMVVEAVVMEDLPPQEVLGAAIKAVVMEDPRQEVWEAAVVMEDPRRQEVWEAAILAVGVVLDMGAVVVKGWVEVVDVEDAVVVVAVGGEKAMASNGDSLDGESNEFWVRCSVPCRTACTTGKGFCRSSLLCLAHADG